MKITAWLCAGGWRCSFLLTNQTAVVDWPGAERAGEAALTVPQLILPLSVMSTTSTSIAQPKPPSSLSHILSASQRAAQGQGCDYDCGYETGTQRVHPPDALHE